MRSDTFSTTEVMLVSIWKLIKEGSGEAGTLTVSGGQGTEAPVANQSKRMSANQNSTAQSDWESDCSTCGAKARTPSPCCATKNPTELMVEVEANASPNALIMP